MAKQIRSFVELAIAASDAALCYTAMLLLALIVLSCGAKEASERGEVVGAKFAQRPCEEIYVVGEEETLHSISDKCGDPFIVERNPHIHDPDDVFPGLVIKIVPLREHHRR